MKRLCLLPLLILTACSEPEEAPPPEPASATPAPAPDPWPGKYSGDLIVRIDSGHKVILIEAAEDGCAGDIGVADGGLATNRLSANEMQLVLHPDPASTSTINIVRSGDTLTVTEKGACGAYHGATCSFSGTATRVK